MDYNQDGLLVEKGEQQKITSDVSFETPAEDKFNLVYLSMILLGCGILFPYNAMLTASDYFDHIWAGKNMTSFVPLMSSLLSPMLQILLVQFGHLLSYRTRIIGGFTIYTIAVISVPLVAENIHSRDDSYYIALILMLIIGASNAILQATIFAVGAMFPPNYSQALMAGNGWSGVIVCLVRIITKASFKTDNAGFRNSAYCFFGSASFTTALCIVAYLFIKNSPFAQRYFNEDKDNKVDDGVLSVNDGIVDPLLAPGDYGNTYESKDAIVFDAEPAPTMISVVKKMWPILITVLMVFIMTFIVFPGTLLAGETTIPKIISSDWLGVTLITIFNVFDLIGRSAPAYFIAFGPSTLIYAVMARFIMYPFFLLLGPADVWHNTWAVIGLLLVFSLSNGYLSTLSFIHAGSYVNDKERAISGGLMSAFLTGGIASGSLIAIAVNKIAGWD